MCYIILMESLDEQLDKAIDENSALQEEVNKLKAENVVLTEELLKATDQIAKRDRRIDQQSKMAIQRDVKDTVRAYAKDMKVSSIKSRFDAIKDPTAQTQFVRSLKPSERAELFMNI